MIIRRVVSQVRTVWEISGGVVQSCCSSWVSWASHWWWSDEWWERLGQWHWAEKTGEILNEVIIVFSVKSYDTLFSSGMEEVLLNETSPDYYGHSLSLPMLLTGQSFTDLVSAFRDDSGVSYTSYGDKFVDFVETSHSRMYQTQTRTWLQNPAICDIWWRIYNI